MKFIVYNSVPFINGTKNKKKRKFFDAYTPFVVVSAYEDEFTIKPLGRGNHLHYTINPKFLMVKNVYGQFVYVGNILTFDYIIANT